VRFTSLESVRDLQFETLSEARSVQFEALSADEKDQIRKLDIITPNFSAVERAAIREQKYESDDKLRRFSDTESAWSKKVRLFALPSKAEGRATTVIPKMICHGKVPQLLVRENTHTSTPIYVFHAVCHMDQSLQCRCAGTKGRKS
jgi:hypothetical protein